MKLFTSKRENWIQLMKWSVKGQLAQERQEVNPYKGVVDIANRQSLRNKEVRTHYQYLCRHFWKVVKYALIITFFISSSSLTIFSLPAWGKMIWAEKWRVRRSSNLTKQMAPHSIEQKPVSSILTIPCYGEEPQKDIHV